LVPVANVKTLFEAVFNNFHDKLARLSLASFSSLL
jgi:hypothetical protein